MDALQAAIAELQLAEVFTVGDDDYEWSLFRAWQAPTGRLYWHADSGCSCTCFGDGFGSVADFGDGDRDALERAFRRWASEEFSRCPTQQVIEGLEKIRQLQPYTY